MPKKKLNLLPFAGGGAAEPSATSSEIVRRQFADADVGSELLDDVHTSFSVTASPQTLPALLAAKGVDRPLYVYARQYRDFRVAISSMRGTCATATSCTGFRTHHRPTAASVNTSGIVVLGSSDGALRVWNLTAECEVQTIAGHFGAINSIAWSDDQKRVVSASEDRSIRVWDVASWRPIAAFTCDWPVSCAAFADDKTIVAGDTVGYLHFLSLEDPNQRKLVQRSHVRALDRM